MRTAKQELNGLYQRNVGNMVGREVIWYVSGLVSDLIKLEPDSDDLFQICAQDDWESPARDEGWRFNEDANAMNHDDHEPHLNYSWQDICEEYSIEPHQDEAYEHWIVSDWLADKLEAKGEMVGRDIHGLTIWGRCTSGQAILLDGVICDIYDELHAN